MSSPESTGTGSTPRGWVLKKRAEKEVNRIHDKLLRERPSAAAHFYVRLMESWDLLARMPLLGRMAYSKRMLRKGYRRFVVDDYLVYYKARDNGVEVYDVVHAARKPNSGN